MNPSRLIAASVAVVALVLVSGCGADSSDASKVQNPPSTRSEAIATAPSTTTTTNPTRPAGSPVELVRTIDAADGFAEPSSVAIDTARDRVFVADSDNRRLVAFGRDGSEPSVIEADGAPLFFRLEGSLGAVAVDRDGTLWVAESGAKRVVHLSPEGDVLSELGTKANFGRLFSVAVDSENGRVYAIDDAADQIIVFTRDGTEIRRLAGPGSKPGQVHDVGSVDVQPDGTLWVGDPGNHRIQHLAADGTVLKVIGPFATGTAGSIEYPNDVAVDATGRIWVADYRGGAVVAFSADGAPLARFGGGGDGYHPGSPVALEFDDDGRLYVVDRADDVVYVYDVRLP